jgi:hypothetical protein
MNYTDLLIYVAGYSVHSALCCPPLQPLPIQMLNVQKVELFGVIRVVKGLSIGAAFGKSCTPCGFIGSIQKISLKGDLRMTSETLVNPFSPQLSRRTVRNETADLGFSSE